MSRLEKINLIQVYDIKHYLCMKKLFTHQKLKNIDYLALIGYFTHIQTEPEEVIESPMATKNASTMLPHVQSARQLSTLLAEQLKSARNTKGDVLDLTRSHLEFDKFASNLSARHRKDTMVSRVKNLPGLKKPNPTSYFNRIMVTQADNHHDDSIAEKRDDADESMLNFSLSRRRHLRPSAQEYPSGMYEMSGVDLYNNHKRRDTLLSVRSFTQLAVSQQLDHNLSMQPLDLTKLIGKIPIPTHSENHNSPTNETEPAEPKRKVDIRGDDTKRLGIIQHIRVMTHTHTHLYPLSRTHKKVPSHSDGQAFTNSHGLVKRTWEEYQNMADSILPPQPNDAEYIGNLQNFKADFGFVDKKKEKNYNAAKVHIENFFHPHTQKNEKIGDQQSHLKGISHRVNLSLSKAEKKGFPSVIYQALFLLRPKEKMNR